MIRALALFLVVHVKVRDSKLNITEIWWERKICFKGLICFVRFWKKYFTNLMPTCWSMPVNVMPVKHNILLLFRI